MGKFYIYIKVYIFNKKLRKLCFGQRLSVGFRTMIKHRSPLPGSRFHSITFVSIDFYCNIA